MPRIVKPKPPTQREVAAALGISLGLANAVLNIPGAPDPAKFHTREKYFARLAKHAIKHGHTEDGILLAAGSIRAPAGAGARAPELSPPPPSAPPPADDFLANLTALRATVKALGSHIEAANVSNPAILPLVDRYQKLLQELRQSEKHWQELQLQRAQLYEREAVHASAAQLWQALRACLDTIIGRLAAPQHLAAWVEEAGGTFPAALQPVLQDRIYQLVTTQVNTLADALAAGAIPETDATPAGRAALADELQRLADRLRR